MSVSFGRHDVGEPVDVGELARIFPKTGVTDKDYGLRYEKIPRSDQERDAPMVLDPTPGLAVCIQTEIFERRDFPDIETACYYLHVVVGFILSRCNGPVRHHVTVMQNTVSTSRNFFRSHVPSDKGGIAARALKARLAEIEKQLRNIDFNGQSLSQIVEAVRRDVWVYHNPPGGKEDGPYSVRVTYLN